MADETPDIPTEETAADATDEMAEAAEAVAAEDATDADSASEASAAPEDEAAEASPDPEAAEAADGGDAPDAAPAGEPAVAGKFASDPAASVPDAVQTAPEETQQQYQAMATKGNSLKLAGDQVLSSGSKEELKQNLPTAIVLKKNLSKDVGQLYEQYKSLKSSSDNPEKVTQFKEACNTVIRDAQKVHQEIKEKVYSVYEKTPPS